MLGFTNHAAPAIRLETTVVSTQDFAVGDDSPGRQAVIGEETHKNVCSRRIGALNRGCLAGYQSENFSALCQINKTRYSDY